MVLIKHLEVFFQKQEKKSKILKNFINNFHKCNICGGVRGEEYELNIGIAVVPIKKLIGKM